MGRIVISLAIVVSCASPAHAECGPWSEFKPCEKVRNDKDIFVGRGVAADAENPFLWRVRVVRSFRGTARGEVIVEVGTHNDTWGFGRLDLGTDYLFYVTKQIEDGRVTRSTGTVCAEWMPLAAVPREEIDFLGHLGSRTPDAMLSGSLRFRYAAADDHRGVAGVRVYLERRRNKFTTMADAKGDFRFAGLPGGTYEISTSGLPADAFLVDPGEIEVIAHACDDIDLQADFEGGPSTIAGRITVASGFGIGPMQIAAMRPDGQVAARTTPKDGGRYVIAPLAAGDYVVCVVANQFYTQTCAPGTRDIAQATHVHVERGAVSGDVDIDVPSSSEVVTLMLCVRVPQGVPPVTTIHVARDGVQDVTTTRTYQSGSVFVPVPSRGGSVVISADPIAGNCAAPLTITSDIYPRQIELIFSSDRCQQ